MKQTIFLQGLTCPACQKLIQKRLSKIPGVEDVQVKLENGETDITAKENITNAAIAKALEGTKYTIV